MSTLVADSSALIEYLLGTQAGRVAAKAIEAPDAGVHVPHLCDVEVASTIRGHLLGGKLTPKRSTEAIVDYTDLPLDRHPHEDLLTRALELRQNFSAYDAVYVALAERLDAALLTTDRPLARAVTTHTELALALA